MVFQENINNLKVQSTGHFIEMMNFTTLVSNKTWTARMLRSHAFNAQLLKQMLSDEMKMPSATSVF